MADKPEPQALPSGNDQDDRGCIATAGYTWSSLLANCVRLFEVGIEMTNPRDPKATSVAYVIIDKSKTQAELFLPGKNGRPLLVNKHDNWVSEKNQLILIWRSGKPYQLKDASGTLLYQIKP